MEALQKNKIIFTYKNNDNVYAHDINLEFSIGEPKLSEIHSMCKDFARVMGFSSEQVEEYFGEDVWDID